MTTNNKPPLTKSTVLLPNGGDIGSLRVQRPRLGHQEPPVALVSNEVPGPWKVRVSVDVGGPGGDGDVIKLTVGFWAMPMSNDPRDIFAGVPAPTGCEAPGPSSGSLFVPAEAKYIPLTMPYMTPDVRIAAPGSHDNGSWFGGGAMHFGAGDWRGESMDPSSYGDFISVRPPGPGEPFGWWPVGYDSSLVSGDPLADFDHPLVGVFFESSSAVYSTGPYPPPFIGSLPSALLGGKVILYNGVHTYSYDLTQNLALQDQQEYQSAFLAFNSTDHVSHEDATCFVTQSYSTWADISHPPPGPDQQTGAQQSGHLLHG